ncbi:uncharacterized protein ACN63O_016634 [Diretmus argenteus]
MDGDIPELPGPTLSLSCLRLLVPPLRLVSAAIWQTIQQKAVADYGMLEEFVFMITEIVPQLLTTRQRAELILGLRARLILELCRSEETADLQILQPHLDRMETLRSLWNTRNANVEVSDSRFLGLVQNLLRCPEERANFFQEVFPEDFGPMYDKAIQTLMWLFLSRLEKLLPTQTLQQIASLLSDTSSVLNECIESVAHLQELKTLLENQKDLGQLKDHDSYIDDSWILSALCLPPVERVVIVNEQSETDAESGVVYTVCTEMEVESETKAIYEEGSGNPEESVQSQWFGLSSDVKSDVDTELVTEHVEGTESLEMEENEEVGMMVIGEDGRSRPVRRNRGLKMKRYLSQRRKAVKNKGSNSGGGSPKKFPRSTKNDNADQRTCKVCGKVVSRAKFLQRHMNRHSTQLPYSCPDCKRFYKSVRYLQQHKCPNQSPTKAKRGRKPKEQEAGKETAAEGEQSSGAAPSAPPDEEWQDNMSQDPDYRPSAGKDSGQKSAEDDMAASGPFYCPHCSVEFKCKQTFRFHLRNICYTEQQIDPEKAEDARQIFKCDECDKAFKYKSTLESHKHTHNPLYCEMCMKLVRDAEALALHKISHTPFQCNRCDENFPVFKALHKHYIDAHNPSGPFSCTHCETSFASLKRFIRHEWKHTGHQPFQCPHCSKRFRSYSDVLEHQKKHTKAYPFLCWECGKKFRHGVTLTRHVEREHKIDKPTPEKPPSTFTCAQCGKTFTSRRCLLKHDNFHHKGLRFPCEHCGKGFFGKDALVRHTLIHTGERPFECTECDKSFRSASELKIHQRYHTGERPYKCSVCDKGFVQSCFLTLHMRTHTGERPYVCTTCDKGFSSLHGLKRHKKLVHA